MSEPDVADDVTVVGSLDLGMTTRHGDVVEADLAVGMATETSQWIVQRERIAGLRAGPDDQRCNTGHEVADTDDDVVVGARRVLQRIDLGEGDGVISDAVQHAAAGRTEPRFGWVPVAALVAKHVGHLWRLTVDESLIANGVEQAIDVGRIAHVDLADPPCTVRIGVERLGFVGQFLVDGDHGS